MKSQPLPCTPAYGYEFHAPVLHPHTPHLQHLRLDLHLESGRKSILNANLPEGKVCTTGVNSPCLLILLIQTKHKRNKMISWTNNQDGILISCLHSLEGELIHWVGKARNMCLIVGRLPIKSGW